MRVNQAPQPIKALHVSRASGLAGFAMAVLLLLWSGLALAASPGSLAWLSSTGPRLVLVTLATLGLCILPGLALLQLCWADAPLTWTERLALAWGLGAGLPPLLLSLLHVLRLPWPIWATALYVLCSALLLLWLVFGQSLGGRRRGAASEAQNSAKAPLHRSTAPPLYAVLLVGLTLLALFARLFAVRDLLVGPNIDSYHHTLIAQLLVEHRGLFTSWEPYAPLSTFTYHYGFHSIVAFVHDLTSLPVWELEPLVGQILAAGVVPLLAVLTFRLTASRSAGLWAALLVGFVNNQPAYYVLWGRFTSITSHLILMALLICWLAAIESARLRPGLIVLSVLACAALVHTHYQTTVLAVVYLAIYMSILMLRAPNLRAALPELGRAMLIVLMALLISAPWLLNTISGELDRNLIYNSERQSTATFAGLVMPPITPFFLHQIVLLLSAIAVLIGLRLRRWRIIMLAAWALASLMIAFPYVFGLPGTGMLDPYLVSSLLYLVMLPLAAYPLGMLHDRLLGQNQPQHSAEALSPDQQQAKPTGGQALFVKLVQLLAVLICIAVSISGLQWQRNLVPDYYRMVTAADMQAFDWIRKNTPADAQFFVHSYPLYGGTMIVGTDAGWWLPLMANRQTNVPPMTYGSEQSIPADWGAKINELATLTRRAALNDDRKQAIDLSIPKIQQALRHANLRYVYIGSQPLQGEKAFLAIDRIDVDKLRKSSAFRLVYDQDGVLIFEMVATQ